MQNSTSPHLLAASLFFSHTFKFKLIFYPTPALWWGWTRNINCSSRQALLLACKLQRLFHANLFDIFKIFKVLLSYENTVTVTKRRNGDFVLRWRWFRHRAGVLDGPHGYFYWITCRTLDVDTTNYDLLLLHKPCLIVTACYVVVAS